MFKHTKNVLKLKKQKVFLSFSPFSLYNKDLLAVPQLMATNQSNCFLLEEGLKQHHEQQQQQQHQQQQVVEHKKIKGPRCQKNGG